MKVIPDMAAEESSTTSEERMKALIAHAWDAVKRLTLQVLLYTLDCLITLHKTSLSCWIAITQIAVYIQKFHFFEFWLYNTALFFFK